MDIVDRAGYSDVFADEFGAARCVHVVAHALLEIREWEEASARRVHAEIFYLRRQVLVGDTEAQLRDALYLDITWGCEGSYCMIAPVPHLCSN